MARRVWPPDCPSSRAVWSAAARRRPRGHRPPRPWWPTPHEPPRAHRDPAGADPGHGDLDRGRRDQGRRHRHRQCGRQGRGNEGADRRGRPAVGIVSRRDVLRRELIVGASSPGSDARTSNDGSRRFRTSGPDSGGTRVVRLVPGRRSAGSEPGRIAAGGRFRPDEAVGGRLCQPPGWRSVARVAGTTASRSAQAGASGRRRRVGGGPCGSAPERPWPTSGSATPFPIIDRL